MLGCGEWVATQCPGAEERANYGNRVATPGGRGWKCTIDVRGNGNTRGLGGRKPMREVISELGGWSKTGAEGRQYAGKSTEQRVCTMKQ